VSLGRTIGELVEKGKALGGKTRRGEGGTRNQRLREDKSPGDRQSPEETLSKSKKNEPSAAR